MENLPPEDSSKEIFFTAKIPLRSITDKDAPISWTNVTGPPVFDHLSLIEALKVAAIRHRMNYP